MSYFSSQAQLQKKELFAGFNAQLIHIDGASIAYIDIDEGATLPEHHHMQQQVTTILEGEFEMTVGGERKVLKAGDVAIIPSNVPHSARALTACKAIDVFQPSRDDYK